jgi:hypothetical protein
MNNKKTIKKSITEKIYTCLKMPAKDLLTPNYEFWLNDIQEFYFA